MQKTDCDTKITFCSYRQLGDEDKKLVEAAKTASASAYAPYSGFMVGAAINCDGTTVTGSNQENASYPCGICAERAALSTAASCNSDGTIRAIAIAARGRDGFTQEPVTPCGICRQALLEYELRQKSPIRIIMHGESGTYIAPSAASLLPLSFALPKENKELHD